MRLKIESMVTEILVAATLLPAMAVLARGGENPAPAPASQEDFFIISSIDAPKHRIVVKRPTEVTELLQVNEMTVYRDEQGRAIELKNLRAGDTVYVTSSAGTDGARVALRIRKGAMTAEELHRRYLSFQ